LIFFDAVLCGMGTFDCGVMSVLSSTLALKFSIRRMELFLGLIIPCLTIPFRPPRIRHFGPLDRYPTTLQAVLKILPVLVTVRDVGGAVMYSTVLLQECNQSCMLIHESALLYCF